VRIKVWTDVRRRCSLLCAISCIDPELFDHFNNNLWNLIVSTTVILIDRGVIFCLDTISLMLLNTLGRITDPSTVYITYLDRCYHWTPLYLIFDLSRYGTVVYVVYPLYWPWIHRIIIPNVSGGQHRRVCELYGGHVHAGMRSST
jgi:hypothetical protein